MTRAASGLRARGLHSGRGIALTAAATVLVIAAAAATLTLLHSHAPGGSAAAGGRASGAASTSTPIAAPTVTPVTAVDSGIHIAVASAAAHSPHARPIVKFLTRYFTAINAHDYLAYRHLFSPAVRSGLSRAAFTAGYATTTDSLARLLSISVIGPGPLDAVVTFSSHQRPGQSPSQSSCTRWRISLFLVRTGHGYLLQAPPSGYRASFRGCR